MTHEALWKSLNDLPRIDQIPVTWDSTGYTSASFDEEVQRDSFTGWDGDVADEDEVAVITRLLQARRGERLLDIACGYGRHDLLLAEAYGLLVTGIDIAPSLIDLARTLAAKRGLDIGYGVRHGRALDWQDEFDHAMVAFNSFSLFSPEDAGAVLRGIRRALKPGGTLFLDLDNKPYNCRYGTCFRNWTVASRALVLQEVYFHYETSVEVARDVTVPESLDHIDEFVCFKRIYSEEEVRGLLAQAGFEVRAMYGNWDLTALNESSPKIILVAVRG